MFDVAPTELLLVAVIALLVIGPKDLPKAMRVVGYWVGRMRGVARQFRAGFDTMVREAELEEMEKRWAAENARIMAEHASGSSLGLATAAPVDDSVAHSPDQLVNQPVADHDGGALSRPVSVEKPEIRPAPSDAHVPHGDGVTS